MYAIRSYYDEFFVRFLVVVEKTFSGMFLVSLEVEICAVVNTLDLLPSEREAKLDVHRGFVV